MTKEWNELDELIRSIEISNAKTVLRGLEEQGIVENLGQIISNVAKTPEAEKEYLQLLSEPVVYAQHIAIKLSILYILSFSAVLIRAEAEGSFDVDKKVEEMKSTIEDFEDYLHSIEIGIRQMTEKLRWGDEKEH